MLPIYHLLWEPKKQPNWYTLPETNIAHENPPFWWYLPGKMGIFHGYASLPEGNQGEIHAAELRRGAFNQGADSPSCILTSGSKPRDSSSSTWGTPPPWPGIRGTPPRIKGLIAGLFKGKPRVKKPYYGMLTSHKHLDVIFFSPGQTLTRILPWFMDHEWNKRFKHLEFFHGLTQMLYLSIFLILLLPTLNLGRFHINQQRFEKKTCRPAA